MAPGNRPESSVVADFSQTYRRLAKRVMLAVEREVIGANVGANGYTTIAQADGLADRLALRRGRKLLDVGCGRGWPGLYLAKRTGCEAVVSDLPAPALSDAFRMARKQRLHRRCAFVLASGTHLPFRPRTFDAVVHTDVLC
jgi:SAM-dependent methyltransferase